MRCRFIHLLESVRYCPACQFIEPRVFPDLLLISCPDEGKPKFDRAEKGGYAAAEPAGGSPKKAALSSQSSFKAEKRISGSYTGGSLQDVFDDFCSFGAGSSGKVSAEVLARS